MPEIMVEPPVLDFQRCFLRHPYEQKVRLTNPSNLHACYGFLDQVKSITAAAVCIHIKRVCDRILMLSLV